MEIIIISLVALFASILTFFSGFGLGTILMPAFALFFPVDVAVALTGVVHLLNNLFKMGLVGKEATWRVVFKFGAPAIVGALIGAWLLMHFSSSAVWMEYTIGTRLCSITPVKVIIACLMFGFAVLELLPFYKNLQFSENKLFIGGAISGFFGGLSGHQGALRSAFLIKCGLSKESFIATGVIIASVVDISRISVYFSKFSEVGFQENASMLMAAAGAAFVGAIAGKKLLKKITIDFVHITVTVMIMLLAIVLGLGII
ncbi:MAG: sulfite exporter TauE/SafE family protein [Bacteroidota bacterium]